MAKKISTRLMSTAIVGALCALAVSCLEPPNTPTEPTEPIVRACEEYLLSTGTEYYWAGEEFNYLIDFSTGGSAVHVNCITGESAFMMEWEPNDDFGTTGIAARGAIVEYFPEATGYQQVWLHFDVATGATNPISFGDGPEPYQFSSDLLTGLADSGDEAHPWTFVTVATLETALVPLGPIAGYGYPSASPDLGLFKFTETGPYPKTAAVYSTATGELVYELEYESWDDHPYWYNES